MSHTIGSFTLDASRFSACAHSPWFLAFLPKQTDDPLAYLRRG